MNSSTLDPLPVTTTQPTLHGSAKFGADETIRYEIRRWWVQRPMRWAAWLMLNPSWAGADRTDRTADRVTDFTRSWGLDGWIGVNLYPFVSPTQPKVWRRAAGQNIGSNWYFLGRNLGILSTVGREASIRIVAFGAQPIDRDNYWLEECLRQFTQPSSRAADEALYCLGTNTNGQPRYPMARGKWRVPDYQRPILWRGT
jgi:hypothetical protein